MDMREYRGRWLLIADRLLQIMDGYGANSIELPGGVIITRDELLATRPDGRSCAVN